MSELNDIVDFVSRQPPFDLLADDELHELCRQIEISYQRRGNVILPLGTDNAELHIIRRGAVAMHDGDGCLIEKRTEGGVFGYPSLLTGQAARLEVRVIEDSLIYHLPAERFHALRTAHIEFDRFFSAALVERLETARTRRAESSHFSQPISDLMSSPVLTGLTHQSIMDVAQTMASANASSLVLLDQGQAHGIAGILTDRDLRRRVVAPAYDINQVVATVMTASPITIDSHSTAMDAVLLMTDAGVHHLPVLDNGRLCGILTLTDLFTSLNNNPVYLAARVRRQQDAASVAAVARRRCELLLELVETGASAEHVGRIMTSITDAATQRLIELAESELGPAPRSYAWLCFGSQARREQTGRTDQDNALLIDGEPDQEAERYFAVLAQVVCDGLNEAGFVYCPGDIMASNAKWRMSLSGWQRQFATWIDTPSPKPLMYASIFFDMRCIAGEADLVTALQQFVVDRTVGNTIFLQFMARNSLEFRPPLGFFRRFALERDGEHAAGLNLKQRGVVPIVSLARMRALELGISAPETVQRLSINDSPNSDLSSLRDALELVGEVRLTHQAQQWKAGAEPDNLVDPGDLSALVKRNLKAAFTIVENAQRGLEGRYPYG